MILPTQLVTAIEKAANLQSLAKLRSQVQDITRIYKKGNGKGKRLLTTPQQILAYQIARMPATYGASLTALNYSVESSGITPNTMIDAGAGTGAATWAAYSNCDSLHSIVCLEREPHMINAGQSLIQGSEELSQLVNWVEHDLVSSPLDIRADLVITSYVLNELRNEQKSVVLKKLWNATDSLFLVICPGTPLDYNQMMLIRDTVLEFDEANLVAPCPHSGLCKIDEPDWCHFTTRIPRGKLHRFVKSAEVPFEDEKFTYLAFARTPKKQEGERILRHPIREKNHISFSVCTSNGIQKKKIFKTDKKSYKIAKKKKCGDILVA